MAVRPWRYKGASAVRKTWDPLIPAKLAAITIILRSELVNWRSRDKRVWYTEYLRHSNTTLLRRCAVDRKPTNVQDTRYNTIH